MLGLNPMWSGMVAHSLIVLKPLYIGDPKMTLKDFKRLQTLTLPGFSPLLVFFFF